SNLFHHIYPTRRSSDLLLPNNTILNTHFDPDLLGGVTVITGEALKLKDGEKEDRLYHASELGLSKINIKAVKHDTNGLLFHHLRSEEHTSELQSRFDLV